MASIFDQMINHETGVVDAMIVAEAAKVRAAAEWRGPDYPPKYLREATEWCNERAALMRRVWRQHKGLPPEDTTMVAFNSYAPDTNE